MKKILLTIVTLIIIAVAALLLFFKKDGSNPYPATTQTTWGKFGASCAAEDVPDESYGKKFHGCDYSVPESEIPVFKKSNLSYNNIFDGKKSLPIMGSAMIDVDNDGVDEVFLAGGVTQQDALMSYKDGGFTKSGILSCGVGDEIPQVLSIISSLYEIYTNFVSEIKRIFL